MTLDFDPTENEEQSFSLDVRTIDHPTPIVTTVTECAWVSALNSIHPQEPQIEGFLSSDEKMRCE